MIMIMIMIIIIIIMNKQRKIGGKIQPVSTEIANRKGIRIVGLHKVTIFLCVVVLRAVY